ncbi:tetratricopeptide repeat protein, partial [Candidatus Omnitrophota bacterium]
MRKISKSLVCCLIWVVVFIISAAGLVAADSYSDYFLEDNEQEFVTPENIRELARIHYSRAREFYRRGEYTQARREFSEVLKYDPRHQGAQWYLEAIQQEIAKHGVSPMQVGESGRLTKSKSLQQALDTVEGSDNQVREQKAKQQAIIDAEEKMQEQKSRRWRSQDHKSRLKYQKQRKQQQAQAVKEAIDDHLIQAKYFYQEGDFAQAEQECQQALELDPKNKEIRSLLQKIARAKSRIAEQKRKTKREAALQAQAKLRKEKALRTKKERSEQLKAKKDNQELEQKIRLHYNQGKKHFKNKDYIAARKEFKDILIFDPKNKYALNAIEKVEATIRKEEREAEQKRRQEEKLAAKQRKETIAQHFGQGKIYVHERKYTQALEEFKQVLILDPGNTTAEKFIIECRKLLVKSQRLKKEHLSKVKQAEKQALRQAQQELANRAEQKAREEERARLEAEQETKKQRQEKIKQHLAQGKIYWHQNQYAQAVEELKQVLILEPDHRSAEKLLLKSKKRVALAQRREQERLEKDKQRQAQAWRREQERLEEEKQRQEREAEREAEQARIEAEQAKIKAEKKAQEQKRQKELARQKQLKETINFHLEGAKHYFNLQEFDQVKAKLDQVFKLDPANKTARQYLSRIEQTIREQERAEVLAERKEKQRQAQAWRREQERLEKEKQRQEREAELARIKAEKEIELARIKAEKEERLRQERLEKEKQRQEREAELARIKAEREAEQTRIEAEKEVRLAKIKAEKEERLRQQLLAKEKQRQEREAEQARIEAEKEARLAKIKAEKEERLRQQLLAKEKQRQEREAEQARIKAEQEVEEQKRKAQLAKQRQLKETIDFHLGEAKYYFSLQEFEQAKAELYKIVELDHVNKTAQKYLTKIEHIIREKERAERKEEQRAALIQRREQERLAKEKQRQEYEADQAKIKAEREAELAKIKAEREAEQTRIEAEKEVRLAKIKAEKEERLRQERAELAQRREQERLENEKRQAKLEAERARQKRREKTIARFLTQGKVYFHQEKYEQARREFKQVLIVDQYHPQAEKYILKCSKAQALAQRREQERLAKEKQRQEYEAKLAKIKAEQEAQEQKRQKELAQQRQLAEKINFHLSQGKYHLREQKLDLAKQEFGKVLFLDHNNQPAQKYLSRMEKAVKQQAAAQALTQRREQERLAKEKQLREQEAEAARIKAEKEIELARIKAEKEAQEQKRQEQEAQQRQLAEKINIHLEEGKYYFKEQEFAQARSEFKQVLALDFKNKTARDYIHKIEKNFKQDLPQFSAAGKLDTTREARLDKLMAEQMLELEQTLQGYQDVLKGDRPAQKEARLDDKVALYRTKLAKLEQQKLKIGQIDPDTYQQGLTLQQDAEYKSLELKLTNKLRRAKTEQLEKTLQAALQRKEAEIGEKIRAYEASIDELKKEKARPFYQQGLAQLKKKQYAQAKESLDKALSIYPDYQRARTAREQIDNKEKLEIYFVDGKDHFENQEYEQARKKFEKIVELDYNHQPARKYLSQIKEQQRRWTEKQRQAQDQAVIEAQKKLAKQKQRQLAEKINIHLEEGKYYFKEQEFAQARSEFKQVLALDFKNKTARDYIHKIEKNLKQDLPQFSAAGKLDTSREVRLDKLMAEQMLELEQTLQGYQDVLKGDRLAQKEARLDDKVALYRTKLAKLEQQKLKIGQIDPDTYQQGLTLQQDAEYKSLELKLTNKLRRAKTEQLEKTLQAALQRKEAEIGEKIRAYEASIDELKKEKARPFYQQGLAQLKKKQYAQAKESLDTALSIYPDYQPAKDAREQIDTEEKVQWHLAQGEYYLGKQEYARARLEFEKVFKLDYRNQQAKDSLNKINSQVREVATAQAQARKEETARRQQAKINFHLNQGKYFFVEEKYSQARSELKKVLALDSTNKPAQDYLSKVGKAAKENARAEVMARAEEKQRRQEQLRLAKIKAGQLAKEKRRQEELAKKRELERRVDFHLAQG